MIHGDKTDVSSSWRARIALREYELRVREMWSWGELGDLKIDAGNASGFKRNLDR